MGRLEFSELFSRRTTEAPCSNSPKIGDNRTSLIVEIHSFDSSNGAKGWGSTPRLLRSARRVETTLAVKVDDIEVSFSVSDMFAFGKLLNHFPIECRDIIRFSAR